MAKHTHDTVAEVLAAVDIVDVIGGSLELKPAGRGRFLALCPFHAEKTPSFNVNHDRQMFYCFGCQKGGDALKFLQEFEGISFPEALKKLADKGGVHLEPQTKEQQGKDFLRTQVQEIGKFAARFYRELLEDPLKGGLGRRYIKTRDFSIEAIKEFRLGYAPEGPAAFFEAARAKGYDEKPLIESGLARQWERGSFTDFFRKRLMFPIRDVQGNVVAFGGRIIEDDPKAPKYINTPENVVYKKGNVLYGLHENREGLRETQCALLVEGYFDVMRCWDAGIRNAVAPCGTALTQQQATRLRHYVTDVVIVFDGDAAGVRAALRSVAILTAAGLSPRGLVLPDGQDPDDYIKAHGGEALNELVEQAADFVSFYVQFNKDRVTSIEGRTEVARELFTILASIDDGLRRDEYLKRTAAALQLDEWSVRREFERGEREARKPSKGKTEDGDDELSYTPHPDDCQFLAAILQSEPLLVQARTGLGATELPDGPMTEVLEQVLLGVDSGLAQRLTTEEGRRLYAAAAATGPVEPELAEMLLERRIKRLKKETFQSQQKRLQEAIRKAEQANDVPRVLELLQLKLNLDREIEKVGAM